MYRDIPCDIMIQGNTLKLTPLCYIKATKEQTEQIYKLVQDTIITIYPKYYPQEVVDFFCELHSKENIMKDIEDGYVGILVNENHIIGTGSFKENHITRVYISPQFQQQGYGSYLIQCLEAEIHLRYDTVYLDASLPASCLYEHRGYETIKHEKYLVKNDAILVYEIMKKQLSI